MIMLLAGITIISPLCGMEEGIVYEKAKAFGCSVFSFGVYHYLHNEKIFKGDIDINSFGSNFSLKDIDDRDNRAFVIKKLVRQYKVHLMSKDKESVISDLEDLLRLIQKDVELQKSIYKVLVRSTMQENMVRRMPAITIICSKGKKKAQYVVNSLYKAFKDKDGLDRELEYNKKVTNFIRYAQGNSDDRKVKGFESYFEQPDMIHYRADITGKDQDYHLNISD